MARTPLELYQSLISCFPADSEEEQRRALRRTLAGPRKAWPSELSQAMDTAGVSHGYVTRHLLSIGRFAPDVVAALEVGLPLGVCRLVNGLATEEARAAALAPLWKAIRGREVGALLPRGVSSKVERTARQLRARQEAVSWADEAPSLEEGWLLPLPDAATPARPRGHIWTFNAQSREDSSAERLPSRVVEYLIATYLSAGDRLVDVTAGAGTIGVVARRFGVASWSGDIEPAAHFVHRIDARELVEGSGLAFGDGTASRPSPGCAQALVIHPPTYPAWAELQDDPSLATIEGYAEDVAAMLSGSIGVLGPSGVVTLITRPVRTKGRVWLVTSHLSQVLTESDLELVGYHVAVADDEREDWHILVGRRS
jgi:hypothetical protein